MQSVLLKVESSKCFTHNNFTDLGSGIESARKLAMQGQQIARLAEGQLRQSRETLKLDAMVLSALQERARVFRKRGIEIFHRVRPVEVIVDAGLLHSLIDAALDWAAGLRRKLTVTLEMKNWPEHGLLMFKTSDAISDTTSDQNPHKPTSAPSDDSVNWYLILEIARAMKLLVSRTSSAQESSLLLEFLRTVNRLEGLTVVEMEIGPESLYGLSKPMAVARVLLISDDARLQIEIKAIFHGTGLVLDCVQCHPGRSFLRDGVICAGNH